MPAGAPATRILLVRHAVTDETGSLLSGRRPGIGLSPRGWEQAKQVAGAFVGFTASGLYSSPVQRCRETASAFTEVLGLEVQEVEGLTEVDFGEWEGRPLTELAREPLWKVVQVAPSRARFPGGESVTEMQVRSVAAVEAIAERHVGEAAVVVAHADVIKAVVAQSIGMHLDHYQRLSVAPASCSMLTLTPFGVLLGGFGAPASLEIALAQSSKPSGPAGSALAERA